MAPVTSSTAVISRWRAPDLHSAPRCPWVQGVVVGVEAQVGLLGQAHDPVDVGHALGLGDPPVSPRSFRIRWAEATLRREIGRLLFSIRAQPSAAVHRLCNATAVPKEELRKPC